MMLSDNDIRMLKKKIDYSKRLISSRKLKKAYEVLLSILFFIEDKEFNSKELKN